MARTYGTAVKPRTPDELAATLADPEKAAAVFGHTPEAWRNFTSDYIKAAREADPSIDRQVAEQTQAALAELLREGGVQAPVPLDPSLAPRSAPRALYSKRAPGAALDSRFDDFGAYAAAVWHGNRTPDAELLRDIRNAFSSDIPSEGGFLIPERLRSLLLEASLETSVVRPRAMVVPMDSLRTPFPTVDDTSHVSSVYGGLVGYWTEEAAALTISAAKFGRVVLDAKKLTVYGEVPNELFQDAGQTFDAFIRAAFPATISHFEDLAFLSGSGVGEPLGVFNAAAKVAVSRTTASSVIWEDILAMAARLLPQSWRRAVWVASNETIPQLGKLVVTIKEAAANVGGSAVWLTNGSADAPTAILGRPLIFTEKASQLGTAGDLSLVDFGFYLLGDRMAASLQTSPHYKFANDQTAVRIVERVDGRPWISSAITPANGGDTLSPYVVLT